jgi:hypothetical protein
MARFYDRTLEDSRRWKDESLTQHLGEATVIDATSLSDYLYANQDKDGWNLLEDFFNIAPPFERFWVECRAPHQVTTAKGKSNWFPELPQEWGVLFLATELSKLTENERFGLPSGIVQGAKWVMQAILFAKKYRTTIPDSGTYIEPQFSWWFPIREDGSHPLHEEEQVRNLKICYTEQPLGPPATFKENPDGKGGTLELSEEELRHIELKALDGSAVLWNPHEPPPPIEGKAVDNESWKQRTTKGQYSVLSLARDMQQMTLGWAAYYTDAEERFWLPLLQPCLMAVCFMHVKNISMEKITPAPKVQKNRVKHGKRPLCTYHVLEIQPFKKVLEREGGATEHTGIRRAFHVCRGHFGHYGMEWKGEMKGKLFGKYSGSYWVPAHLRGAIDVGLADKSYRVVAKQPEEKQSA